MTASFADVAAGAHMVSMLPCADVDEIAEFWIALGLERTYRQVRPNPYVALALGGIDLHYYGMPAWDPEVSHSTCAVVVPDTAPVYEAFTAGLRTLYGKVPVAGLPRITRPRRRANNGALSGFSLVDPAGNWVRFSRAPDGAPEVGDGVSTTWTSTAGDALARATENAVVVADSHGDVVQARKLLAGAVRRAEGAEPAAAALAAALAYLAELHVRAGDPAGAREALGRLEELAAALGGDVDEDARPAVEGAVLEARQVVGEA